MRHLVIAAMAVALAACSSGDGPDNNADIPAADTVESAPETLDAIPAAFQGRWDFAEDTCADEGSEMRLDIEANSITYYESSATPVAITRNETSALTIDHLFSGEGEEWNETLAYMLSEDGERLTVTSPDGSISIRMHCPS
jgi:hypothetical protein